jgi:hypothetical protein
MPVLATVYASFVTKASRIREQKSLALPRRLDHGSIATQIAKTQVNTTATAESLS